MNRNDLLRLAVRRTGCTDGNGQSTRALWRVVYRQFRDEAHDVHAVDLQLRAFRGFGAVAEPRAGDDMRLCTTGYDENA